MMSNSNRSALPNVEFHDGRGRVLLPRPDRPRPQLIAKKKERVPKACTSCRKRKSKCSGNFPCFECTKDELPCVYEYNRRDQLTELTLQKQLLLNLVQDLRLGASPFDQRRIENALDELDEKYTVLRVPQDGLQPPPDTHSGFNQGSGHPTDPVAEDVNITDFWAANHDPQLVAGQPESATHWPSNVLQDVTLLGELRMHTEVVNTVKFDHTVDARQQLPDQDLEMDLPNNIYESPPVEVAYRLIPHFLHTVHNWIPILPFGFEDQVRMYYESPWQVTNKWLATFNLVLAIGARHSFLVNCKGRADGDGEREDIPYVSRAIQLLRVQDSALMTSTPDIPMVQCYGLLSLYYLTAHGVDRAWLAVGMAIRLGIALNLHLKYQDNTPYPGRAEMLSQTWWSLRLLECFLCATTGRPSAVPLQDCNMPLPRALFGNHHGGQSTALLQLYCKISITTQWALSSLYSVRAATLPWASIQDRVITLKTELETVLPQISDRERLMLHFSWFDSIILITRPCLSIERSRDDLSDSALQISQNIARDCIQAARGVTQLLLDEPDERIYRNGPWWCLSHYIMRAMAIFLLAMSSQVSIDVDSDVVPCVKKLIHWLQWMQHHDRVAAQGLAVVLNTLNQGTNHSNFADVLEQEASNGYRGYLLVPGRWQANTDYPHFLSEPNGLDDLLDSDGLVNNVILQSHSDALPMPPVYGSAFASADNMWA